MPRARNTTVGPEADALDAAAMARNVAEEAANSARLVLLTAAIEAIDAGMSVAEAARRAGYTREHMSKLHASTKRGPEAAPMKRATKRPPAKPAGE